MVEVAQNSGRVMIPVSTSMLFLKKSVHERSEDALEHSVGWIIRHDSPPQYPTPRCARPLKDHFHLHCLVPAGALSSNHSRWIGARPNFLFPVTALSQVFQGKFLALLQQACDKGKIPPANNEIKASRQKSWVVYAKKPFGSPQTVLDYLGRYTHRVALSNERILSVQNGQVTLSYRDRKDGNRKTTIPLDAQEFIRRFLLHVLPDGFMRIRHFGFLANRSKKQALAQCRRLLKIEAALPQTPKESAKDLLLRITGIDLSRCPSCHRGTMIVVAELPPISSPSQWDSS